MTRPSLRIVVILIAGVAGLKVWAQDRYHRSVFHEAILSAYADQARARCQKEFTRSVQGKGGAHHLSATEVVIGSPYTSVAVWDVDNPLWDVRYRHPHIMISSDSVVDTICAYDLVAGLASLGAAKN